MPIITTFGAGSSRGWGYSNIVPFSFTQTGGTLSSYGGYNILKWTGAGNFTVKSGKKLFDVFVVGGGGGGGWGQMNTALNSTQVGGGYFGGSGGGAGGLALNYGQLLQVGSYSVTVGSGGTAGSNLGSPSFQYAPAAGGSSSFGTTTVNGGQPGANQGPPGGTNGNGSFSSLSNGNAASGGAGIGYGGVAGGYSGNYSSGYLGGSAVLNNWTNGTNLGYGYGGNAPNTGYTQPSGNGGTPAPIASTQFSNVAGIGDGGSGAWAEGANNATGGNFYSASAGSAGLPGLVMIRWLP
jgi:hypothetical protein